MDDIEPGITPSPTVTELYRKILKEQSEREDHLAEKPEQMVRPLLLTENRAPTSIQSVHRPTNDLVQFDLAAKTQPLLSPAPDQYV